MPHAKLRLPEDRALLSFIFARFIDGEMTGLLEGRALGYAPTLQAADFLARQVRDEIRHAQMYVALYRHVNQREDVPRSPWLLKAIMAPVTGRLWAEHCFLDKALGERWVLYLMQQLIEDTQDERITRTLRAIAKDEEEHIAFGEAQTRDYANASRFRRYYLWGLFLRLDLAMAIAYRLLRPLIRKRYSEAAAVMLTRFFTESRDRITAECAALLGVSVNRSLIQMLVCQLLFWIRLPFVGWFRGPRPGI
ncbi:MAG TPA: ferritin-like domain-containing protein [Turneriella sp.]|nr:ferritin-like domain-containing protein [Turneriella sp.]